jgi:hypothetical protein
MEEEYKTMNVSSKKYPNEITMVSIEDYDTLNKHKWHIISDNRGMLYVTRTLYNPETKKYKIVLMHRIIMQAKDGEIVDHINRNTFDNRRCNLRITDFAGNSRNRKLPKNNTSGYKGVSFEVNRWKSYITFNNIDIRLGRYKIKEDAALAYDFASKILFEDKANPNFPDYQGEAPITNNGKTVFDFLKKRNLI